MLRDILQSVSEVLQLKPASDAAIRAQLLRYINRAATEIYDSVDLPGSLWEQFFSIDSTQGQITMPWYVDQLRGVRANWMARKITLHDMRPRYHSSPWHQQPLEWRVRGRTPLMRGLGATSQLVVTIPTAQDTTFSVTIVGETTTSAVHTETLTFTPGSITQTTAAQWPANDPVAIRSISKDAVTDYDVTVATTADPTTPVAIIPNRLSEARNILIAVNDLWLGGATIPVVADNVEILYKRSYLPLYEDTDVFCDPKLDEAIVWKCREHWYSKDKDEFALSQAAAASAKCSAIITSICANQESETEKVMQVAPNRFSRAWELTDSRWSYRGYYGM